MGIPFGTTLSRQLQYEYLIGGDGTDFRKFVREHENSPAE